MDSNKAEAPATNDALRLIVSQSPVCPTDVFAFRALLKNHHLLLKTSLVANRGFHNPSQGSFSLFEWVTGQAKGFPTIEPGEFFFGHFTDVDEQNRLIANQYPEKNALMIEAFAWDYKKNVFNFYELRGDGEKGQWFYRGDSLDIFADNSMLHRQLHPTFGDRLRCSGCHGQGGPIMKELFSPHNDWWTTKRPLDFGGRKPDESLSLILTDLVSAEELASAVQHGLKKLNQHQAYQSSSLQEQLRPLFCPVEVNFVADESANDEYQANISIPSDFFIDSRLLPHKRVITISRTDYQAVLVYAESRFPETSLLDADHAWLAPVKALSDQMVIDSLIKRGVISDKFVADVLAVDMANPVFSSKRCELLSYLPLQSSPHWLDTFIYNLKQSPSLAAKDLLANLTDPTHTKDFYQQKAEQFLQQCQEKLTKLSHVEKMYALLAQRRLEIQASEISANPRGQILEPGFRVIFPSNNLASIPGYLEMNEQCDVKPKALTNG
ncbi:hypothetical protein [Legionella beliardensis]|uniref:hypothetical protein n=1 Tax=Legionella beliardensis TaxID=91822 RepID=UPI0013EF701B|nr:hypothetical protein [Legionella beliardensis]